MIGNFSTRMEALKDGYSAALWRFKVVDFNVWTKLFNNNYDIIRPPA